MLSISSSLFRPVCAAMSGALFLSAAVSAQVPDHPAQSSNQRADEQSHQQQRPQNAQPWVTINAGAGYRLEGGGDPLSKRGADVRVVRDEALGNGFGGAGQTLDAMPYRGQQVVLSATLEARGDAHTGLIWLRADGNAGKSIAFMNSQEAPVISGEGAQYREVFITVPETAVSLSFGSAMHGAGAIRAKRMLLEARAPKPVKPDGMGPATLDAAIRAIKTHALNADKIDWASVEPKLRAEHADIRNGRDAYPAIQQMLMLLEDRHSHLVPPVVARQGSVQGMPTENVVVKALGSGIGYVSMPGFSGNHDKRVRAFTQTVADEIAKTSSDAQRGWVVDLRSNAGGNMYPMIAALSSMLGDDVLGSFQDRHGVRTPWQVPVKSRPKTNVDLRDVSVAVLIGPKTASSGEATALSFHGRPNTRFFGQPTAGLSTGNGVVGLPDGAAIALTTVIMLDRNGHGDGASLVPDEPVAADVGNSDATLEAAIRWLSASG